MLYTELQYMYDEICCIGNEMYCMYSETCNKYDVISDMYNEVYIMQ